MTHAPETPALVLCPCSSVYRRNQEFCVPNVECMLTLCRINCIEDKEIAIQSIRIVLAQWMASKQYLRHEVYATGKEYLCQHCLGQVEDKYNLTAALSHIEFSLPCSALYDEVAIWRNRLNFTLSVEAAKAPSHETIKPTYIASTSPAFAYVPLWLGVRNSLKQTCSRLPLAVNSRKVPRVGT